MDQGQSQTITLKPRRCWYCKKCLSSEARYDAKFCNSACRYEWHQKACHIGKKMLTQETILELAELAKLD